MTGLPEQTLAQFARAGGTASAHGVIRVTRIGGMHRLGDALKITNGKPLAQHALQQVAEAMQRPVRCGDQISGARSGATQSIEHARGLLHTEQFPCATTQHFHQVRGERARGVDHRHAARLQFRTAPGIHPHGRQSIGRLGGGLAVDGGLTATRIHGQQRVGAKMPRPDHGVAQADAVAVGRKRCVIAHAHGRHHHAEILRKAASHAGDAIEQAIRSLVRQTEQLQAKIDREWIDRQRVVDCVGAPIGLCDRISRGLPNPRSPQRRTTHQRGGCKQRHRGQWREGEANQQCRDHPQRGRTRRKLTRNLLTQTLATGGLRAHQAAGRGHQERGNLRDQTVAHRQQREDAQAVAGRPALLQHTDQESAHDVGEHDHQTGDRVAAHEATRAIHGAVEVRLAKQFLAAATRFGGVDGTAGQIRIHRHLTTGQRVERESRGDFTHAHRTARDHDELHHHQHGEHAQAHDGIAASAKQAEGLDDAAGAGSGTGRRCRIGAEDQSRAGHVEAQSQQRGAQNKCGEHAEIKRPSHAGRGRQHHTAEREVDGDQRVHGTGGQRQHEHGHQANEERRHQPLESHRARHQASLQRARCMRRRGESSFAASRASPRVMRSVRSKARPARRSCTRPITSVANSAPSAAAATKAASAHRPSCNGR